MFWNGMIGRKDLTSTIRHLNFCLRNTDNLKPTGSVREGYIGIIISVVYHRLVGMLQWKALFISSTRANQESSSIVKIMQDVLSTIKLENKEISKAYFQQDNAGCYHSSSTILSCLLIPASIGVKIHRINFSDLQGGKGAADR